MTTVSCSCLVPITSYIGYQDPLTREAKVKLAWECVALKYGSMGKNLCGEHGTVM